MITSFWVYIWGYQLDVRFGSPLGCLQIIFLFKSLSLSLKSHMNVLQVNWIVEYKFIVWSIFIMVSSLILFRSLRVYVLKQLFFSISVNRGFRNIYLAASRLSKYLATIHLDFKE